MRILRVSELTQQFEDHFLYHHTEFEIYQGDHLGLVGQNGVGKSTFFHILTGTMVPDYGKIEWAKHIRVGYLDQYAQLPETLTLQAYLRQAFTQLDDMARQMEAAYQASVDDDTALKRAGMLQDDLLDQGYYQIETLIDQMINGLGMADWGKERALGTLSGGQKTKVILAKLLLEKPDVLLLDEPTNFLDHDQIQWLADYLKHFSGSFVIISHDHVFLQQVTNGIYDLEFGQMTKYHGDYAQFVKQKAAMRLTHQRAYQSQQRYIARTEAYIRKNKAGVNSKIARGRQKQLDRLVRLQAPVYTHPLQLTFHHQPVLERTILTVKDLSVGYTTPLFEHLYFHLDGRQKIALKGFNGVGKTTLIKTILQELEPLAGHVELDPALSIGYYAQDFVWEDPLQTPFEVLTQTFRDLSRQQINHLLSRFGIDNALARRALATLSGGEQAKVKLALLCHERYHLLIMDEPTNHLDQETKQSLKQALQAFPGALLLVSHEEAFLDGLIDFSILIQ